MRELYDRLENNLDLISWHSCTNIIIQILCHRKNCYVKSYGRGIVEGRIGGWGTEGGADRVVRNGSTDGVAASVAFRSIVCPFLYTVKVMFLPAILCWPI